MKGDLHSIEVWGEFACFTRPELKVERYSYPVITPSSARGIFDSIYWKPGFYWQVESIIILKPIRYVTLKRNEVKDKVPSDRTIQAWIKGVKQPEPILADGTGIDNKGRTQRQTMALKDVRYYLTARPVINRDNNGKSIKSVDEQFIRRAKAGKCFQRPYLGCREFVAFYKHIEKPIEKGLDIDMEIGWMTYDIFNLNTSDPSNKRMYSIFWAEIHNGLLSVPPFGHDSVKKERVREQRK